MGRNTVILLVLILELVCVFGFYLSEVKNQTDVYEVKEDKTTHSLTIISPKAEKPTLREIIYYHIIETPYEQEQVINQHTSDTEHNNEIITGNQYNISGNDRLIENEYIIGNKYKVPDTDDSVIDKEQTVNERKLSGNKVIDDNDREISDNEYIDNDRRIGDIENNGKEIDFADGQRKFTNGHGYQYYSNDPESEAIPDDSSEIADDDQMINSDSKELVADPMEPVDDDNEMIDTDSKQIIDPMEPDDEMIDSDSEPLSDDNNPEDDRTMPDKNDDYNADEETMSRIENFLTFLKSVEKPADLLEPKVDDQSIDLKSKDTSYHAKENGDNDVEKHAVTKRNPENDDMTKQENHPSRNEDAMGKTLARKKRSLNKEGRTYGMSLTGDEGVVWNDFNDVKFPIGTTNNEIEDDKYKDQLALRSRRADDEDINEDTDKSDSDLEKASSEEEPNNDQPDIEKPSTEKSNIEEPSAEKTNIEKFSTNKLALKSRRADDEDINEDTDKADNDLEKASLVEEPNNNQPDIEEPITEKSNIEEPSAEITNIEKFSTKELSTEKPRKSTKTYGMSLTGDQGMVWNDLNGQRVSYHVGDSAEENENNNSGEDKPSFKASKDDEEINAKIEKFEKDLEESTSKEKPDNVEPTTVKQISEKPTAEESRTEKPITGKPGIKESTTDESGNKEITTEEPTNAEPNTKKPEKPADTYGMSLNGDHGIVWNDLNGPRVSYHVGEPTIENEENINNKVPDAKDLDEILANSLNPFDDGKDADLNPFLSSEIDDIFGNSKETDKSQNNVLNKDIIEIIKEVVKNETAKLEDKLSCNNANENDDKNESGKGDDSKKDKNIITSANSLNGNKIPEDIQQVTNNEQFWKWLNDWSSAYTELLINRVDMHIKEEVAKQIQEIFATLEHKKATNNPENDDVDNHNDVIDDKKEIDDFDNNVAEKVANGKEPTKKRPDKDSENKEKGAPVKINASNVYGNSVGNGNVTNIFIFNINDMSDLVNVKPLVNGTDGIYVFGNDDEKVDTDKDSVELHENKDKVEAQTTGNQNESSSNIPHDQDTTTEKTTPKPDVTEENTNNKATESPKETVEFTTKLPENEDSQEKGEEQPNKLNGHNGNDQTTEKVTDKTTETLSENVESTTQLPDKENSEENDKTESKDGKDKNYNSDESKDHGYTASSNSKEVEDKDSNISESEDNNTKDKNSVEVGTSKDSNEDKEKDDKDKHNVENAEKHTNKDKNASEEKVDKDDKTESKDDQSKTNKDTSQNSKEDKNNISSKSEDNNTIDKNSVEVDPSEDSKEEKDDEDKHNVEDTKNHTDNSEDKKDSNEKVETNDKVDQETDSKKSTEVKDKHSVEDTENSKETSSEGTSK